VASSRSQTAGKLCDPLTIRRVRDATASYLGGMVPNGVLRQSIEGLGLTYAELADRVNHEIRGLTGGEGTVSERTVQTWVSGATRWPTAKTRVAIERVFGQDAIDLGFHPRRPVESGPVEVDSVRRRDFVSAAAAVPLSAALSAPTRIGLGDVRRLESRFAEIVASDHRHGGMKSIETLSLQMAQEALDLQQRGSASQRVRSSIYGAAAAFTSSAMWAAIDGRRFDDAQGHLDQAVRLATLSGDSQISFRIWSHAGSMYRHMGRVPDALAANDVARSLAVVRRDPLFASLGHARHAAILGLTGDRTAVTRAIGRAQDALTRAEVNEQRPLWLTAFYDQSELESLSLTAHLALGENAEAESHAHRCLALLRPDHGRSRAIATARLARAQLGQMELELAVSTASEIEAAQRAHPRVAGMLDSFGRRLGEVARRSAATATWEEHSTPAGGHRK
jgi:hypothetical protein